MINKDRIVPVTKTDLLSLVGMMLTIKETSYTVLASKDVEGTFEVTGSGAAGNKLADQPVKSLDFKSGVTSGTVYFVAADDYEGIKVAGAAATFDASYLDDDDVKADGSVYKAVLGSGEITLTSVSPQAA